MNNHRTFIAAVLVAAVLFLSFVLFYENYNRTHEQKAVDNHARVVAISLWAYHPGLARDYLQLACRLNKYKKLEVTSLPDESFIVVNNELDDPVDLFFSNLALLRNVSLSTSRAIFCPSTRRRNVSADSQARRLSAKISARSAC